MKDRSLTVEQLKKKCDPNIFPFATTAEVEPLEGLIGQERAVRALDFGLRIKKPGYHIFITGMTGTGRNSYAQALVDKVAAGENTPGDWCYLYNFEKPDQPQAIKLPAGIGLSFQDDMKKLLEQVMDNIPSYLASEEHGKYKAMLLQGLQEKQNQILTSLNETAKSLGFALKNTDKGLVTIPLNTEGKPMEEEEFNNLELETTNSIEEKSKELNLLVLDAFKKIKELEKETQEDVEEKENQLISEGIAQLFSDAKEKYSTHPGIGDFLDDVQKDILKNARAFKEKNERLTLENFLLREERAKDLARRYQVNVLVDNGRTGGAPVVVESNPTYYNLTGKVEYESQLGVLTTDFMKIKAGDLHKANGGYLILKALDVLTNPFSWNALKRALKTGKICIENLADQMGMIATSSLKPESIPLDLKVILIGTYYEYSLLYHYDEDFRKLFKIKADFDVEMDRTKESAYDLARFVKFHCARENLRPFTREAMARIVEYSSRLAGNQKKLSSRFNELMEIVYEANTWAELDNAGNAGEVHVLKAIREKRYRSNKLEKRLQELVEEGVILIDTADWAVGQVNGLAVLDAGDYSFAKPTRITVNTYIGQKGIVNIEREAKLSGPIHDKGVLIMSGYLGEKFGGRCPLSFSASICFEQSYDGVDGDSASSAELYALLSSLAGVALRQSLAVTGSVNQKGIIQPIGGVNQKIEGFYQVCKARGLTGEQGVIIPIQNINNLMLEDEVIEAVKRGEFYIFAIRNIEEGLELLSGKPAAEVFDLVEKRIREIYDCVKDDKKPREGGII